MNNNLFLLIFFALLYSLSFTSSVNAQEPTTDTLSIYKSSEVIPETINLLTFTQPTNKDSSDKVDTVNLKIQIDQIANTIQKMENEKEKIWRSYREEHLRLEGLLRSTNTDNGLYINTYQSEISRTGESEKGLEWTIRNLNISQPQKTISWQLKTNLNSIFKVLERYNKIRELNFPWKGINIEISGNKCRDQAIIDVIKNWNTWNIPLHTIDDTKVDQNILLEIVINSPTLFNQDYEHALNQASEIDYYIRVQQMKLNRIQN